MNLIVQPNCLYLIVKRYIKYPDLLPNTYDVDLLTLNRMMNTVDAVTLKKMQYH